MATESRQLPDLQQSAPPARISLTRAGVTRSAKSIRIRHDSKEQLFQADVTCAVDLNPDQKGVHMSRFEEAINQAIDEVVIEEALHIEALAETIARRVVDTQQALRSEVTINASYPLEKTTPVTGVPTQEMYDLIGIAAVGPSSSRRAVGVSAQGMNACPCAQELIRAQATDALADDGFDEEEIERIVQLVPVATHNQRARATLLVGVPDERDVPAEALLEIAEDSMSSEIYEVLKRPDEQYVVDRAHRRPRFVEDSVREMVRTVAERFPDLPDDTFVRAHQENFETIHTHDVEAERSGTLGEIRRELADGTPSAHHAKLTEWLGGVA
jgi:GTP cyclohydrolase-4